MNKLIVSLVAGMLLGACASGPQGPEAARFDLGAVGAPMAPALPLK